MPRAILFLPFERFNAASCFTTFFFALLRKPRNPYIQHSISSNNPFQLPCILINFQIWDTVPFGAILLKIDTQTITFAKIWWNEWRGKQTSGWITWRIDRRLDRRANRGVDKRTCDPADEWSEEKQMVGRTDGRTYWRKDEWIDAQRTKIRTQHLKTTNTSRRQCCSIPKNFLLHYEVGGKIFDSDIGATEFWLRLGEFHLKILSVQISEERNKHDDSTYGSKNFSHLLYDAFCTCICKHATKTKK